jgi:hypothetical protein
LKSSDVDGKVIPDDKPRRYDMTRMTELDLTLMRHGWTSFDAERASDRLKNDRERLDRVISLAASRISSVLKRAARAFDRLAGNASGQFTH